MSGKSQSLASPRLYQPVLPDAAYSDVAHLSPFLPQTGTVFACQFNAVLLGWKRKMSISCLQNFTGERSPFFTHQTLPQQRASAHTCASRCKGHRGLVLQAVSKHPQGRRGSCKRRVSIYRKSYFKRGSFWGMTPSGSTAFSTVLPLTIGCANRYLNLLTLHVHLPLQEVQIPTWWFWEFSTMAHSLFLIVPQKDTSFFFFLSGEKNKEGQSMEKLMG